MTFTQYLLESLGSLFRCDTCGALVAQADQDLHQGTHPEPRSLPEIPEPPPVSDDGWPSVGGLL